MNKSDLLRQLWLAGVLLTRAPLPVMPQAAFAQGAQAVWAYPVIGVAVGLVGALAGQIALGLGLPVLAAAVLTLAAMTVLTGAMHEDGLADVADGFWGGFAPERRLEIMRDSQIGTYGVLALVGVSVLRMSAIAVLLDGGSLAIIAAAGLSRAMMPAVMCALPAARQDGLAHSVGQPTQRVVLIALGAGALSAFAALGLSALAPILVAVLITAGIALLAKRKIGGQTGDVLGATQQLSEVAVLLCCAAML